MKEVLGAVGAIVATTVILVIPVLSFVSFVHDWNGFFITFFLAAFVVDFLFVLELFMRELLK